MNTLPIDTSNPAVRDYLSLIRLQVLTPLSLLINIASVLVCATVVKPTIGDVSRTYPTSISPKPWLIAVYIAAIWLGQIGYCFLLLLATKTETKKTVVNGVGLTLVMANWLMAMWAIAWVFQSFVVATVLQGFLLGCLLYSNIVLLIYHPPVSSRPFDTALIHAPFRCFFILPQSVLFPYSLFITLGLAYEYDHSPNYAAHPWSGFAVVFSTNLLGIIVILLRRDIVWCVAATWICISMWIQTPKPAPVYITVMLFTVLHPLALFSTYIYWWFYRKGQITLPSDAEEQSGTTDGERMNDGAGLEAQRPAREVDAEELWG